MPEYEADVLGAPTDGQDVDATTSEAPVAPSTTEADEVKKLRDRLSASGREAAEARRIAIQQASEISTLREHLTSISSSLSKQESERMEARLNTLPPEQRAAEEIKQLKRRLESVERPRQHQPAQTQETPDQYTRRRAQEIIQDANFQLGLDDNKALTGNEPELDINSFDGQEVDYFRAVRKLAKQRLRGENVKKTDDKKTTPAKPENVDDVV